MSEKFRLYNEQGQVENPDVARAMANAENSSHEKTLGMFPPSKKKLAEGEKLAEIVGEDYVERLNKSHEVAEKVSSFEFTTKGVKLEVNGHLLDVVGEIRPFRTTTGKKLNAFDGSAGTIDGIELSKDDLKRVMEKLSGYLANKFTENSDEANGVKKLEEARQLELTKKNRASIEEVLK
jgi:hypothetical protein